jgi:uncharacterized protein (DUF169 family)
LEILKRFKRAVDNYLSVATLPIAVKLLQRREDVPINIGRPIRDLGEPIRPCVGWHLARHKGLSVAMLEEDFSTDCPHALFIFGILEPIQQWIEGDLSYEISAGSREAAANMARNLFRLDVGKYKGMALAPLGKADFTPDLVMIYCNSRQAQRLILAAGWTNGEPVKSSMAGTCVCSESIVQPFQIGQPVVAIPCGGDREYAGAQDHEIVFTTPLDKLEGIIKGLEASKRAHKLETLGEESKLEKRYSKMAKALNGKMGR